MRVRISPFETRVLRAVDDAVLAAMPKPGSNAGLPPMRNVAAMDDPDAVKSLIRGLGHGVKRTRVKPKKEGGKHG